MFVDRLARRIRRHFGIASAGFVVRPRFSLSAVLVGCFVGALCACFFLFFSEARTEGVEVEALRRQVLLQSEELRALRVQVGGGQSFVEMERSSRSEMLARVRNLEQENAALKEDMLLFERLVPSLGEEASIRIESFRLQREVDGRFRYRWLVGYRPSKVAPEFHGKIQVVVTFSDEEGRLLMLPDAVVGASEYRLDVKSFARGEGRFAVPYGGRVKAVELRVLQNGVIKARRLEQL